MKILILYASRGGATQECAELLAGEVSRRHEPQVVNAREALPDPQGFDAVVIGSSIRFGSMDRTLKKYLKRHATTLSAMPTAIFFCCGYPRLFEEYTETQLPRALTCSLGLHSFGGELKPAKRHGFDKLAVWWMRSSILSEDFEESDADHHALPELLPENVRILAQKLNRLG